MVEDGIFSNRRRREYFLEPPYINMQIRKESLLINPAVDRSDAGFNIFQFKARKGQIHSLMAALMCANKFA